jgi:hypothetical protein
VMARAAAVPCARCCSAVSATTRVTTAEFPF